MLHRMMCLAVAVALTGLAGCGPRSLMGDDNLPPIVVLGGSLDFKSSEGWDAPGSNGRWRQRSQQGGAPTGFRATQNGTECLPRRQGPLEITYTDQGGAVRTFELLGAGANVFLDPRGLALAQEDGGRTLSYKTPGTVGTIRFKGQATPECKLANGPVEVIAQR